jgi:hypothetical protein
MLFAIDFYDDFIDEKCVAVATMLSLQSSGVNRPELDTPQANRLAADGDTSLSEQILDVSMTEVKAEYSQTA